MTVDSPNIEAVSSRTKPTKSFLPQSLAESVLSCPKCGEAMEPMLLGVADDGTQSVWWTCCEVKNKKCTFPLNMPADIFWVTRSAQDIEKNEVPPPNLANLPIRYQHLYPTIFQSSTKKSSYTPRQGSHESTRSISSGPSDSAGSSNSVWDPEETNKSRAANRLETMRKPKVVSTQKHTFIPSLTGSRAMALIESLHKEEASNSMQTRLKLGRGEKKITTATRDAAKKKVIHMLSTLNPSSFKHLDLMQVKNMKKAVIEHVKKRRAEREQLAELDRITKRNEVVDVDELIKRKLQNNKRRYEERRIELAREARKEAAKRMRLAGVAQSSVSSMPGYGDEEEDEGEEGQQHHDAYAVTPPYLAEGTSPHPDASSFPQEFDYVGEEFNGINPMDMAHSYEEEGDVAVSPFAELGPLTEDDLEGIVNDPSFEDNFAAAFGDDFADLSHYN